MTEAKFTFTYQGRLNLEPDQSESLDAYAERYTHAERCLYADMRKTGKSASVFKNSYQIEYGLTARQFNAVAMNLEGKIASVKELLPQRREDLTAAIGNIKRVIKKLEQKKSKAANSLNSVTVSPREQKRLEKLHQKKRRLHILETKLANVKDQIASGDPQICFGGRKLFHAQYNLEINGFLNHGEWQEAWRSKRNSQFFVIGSGDENMGCQGCVIAANLDGTFNLKLRMPGKVASYTIIENVRIPYGQDVLREAIRRHTLINTAYTRELADARAKANAEPKAPTTKIKKPLGPALSYRFLKDAKGWKVFISTEMAKVQHVSIKSSGSFGVDINADCIAATEIDNYGNLVGTEVYPLVTYGLSSEQAEAAIGDVVKEIVTLAAVARKPIVTEKLDFSKKKAALKDENPKYARMLSSFAYNAIGKGIRARAFKEGVEIIEVNPAYTSQIGLANYAKAKGLSVHQAAAFAIARRGSGFRERPIGKSATIPTSTGDHVTFPQPARNRGKHVWTFWRASQKFTKTVLAAHAWSSKSGDPSKQQSRPWKGNYPAFTVRFRDVNRPQNCSAGVGNHLVPPNDIIPW